MVAEAFLLEAENKFEDMVVEAFKNLKREGPPLGDSPLVDSSLIADCLLAGESLQNSELRKQGMRALLRWALDKMRPYSNGTPDIHSLLWRPYCVLFYHYWEGKRIRELDTLLSLGESTVDKAVALAHTAATKIIRDELQAPGHLAERKIYFFQTRYTAHAPDEQKILRLLGVINCPLPVLALQELTKQNGVANSHDHIKNLPGRGLAIQDQISQEIKAHPDVVTTLVNLTAPDEQRELHEIAADYFSTVHDDLTSASHRYLSGKIVVAATQLIENYRTIVEDGRVEEFYTLQKKFHRQDLDEVTWARLKIATGRAALLVGKVEIAREEFRKAQKVEEPYYKAEACYYHAKASEKIKVKEALALYDQAIAMLEPFIHAADQRFRELLIQVHVDKAWVYIQENLDLAKAEAQFIAAQKLITQRTSTSQCLLFNGWGGFYWKRNDLEQEEEYKLKAWAVAGETPDVELLSMVEHNLGLFYVLRHNQINIGLNYLHQARTHAHEIRHRELESKCEQAIGAACYLSGQYDAAIEHYKIAYTTYKRIGNHNWQAWVCYDLAEAYAKQAEYGLARVYYNKAVELAPQVAANNLFDSLTELAERFPQLTAKLTETQTCALKFVDTYGKITNSEYQALTGVSAATALRELKTLMNWGILASEGKGRSACYRRKSDMEVP